MTPGGLRERVLYRDALLLVIDKPAGMPVHPGPAGDASIEDLLDGLRFGLASRPQLAHRLDHDTSGCLALGRNPRAVRKLGRLFSAGLVEKVYWAVCEGAPPQDDATIELPIKKLSRADGWTMVVAPDGLASTTRYRVMARNARRCLVEFRPMSGRTHQIRVHAAHLSFPVVGDRSYGSAGAAVLPQLHARSLVVPLREAQEPIRVTAPLPPHMQTLLRDEGLSPA